MRRPALPNFFVIGAVKCGTTTLYHWLRQHPDVYLPRIKEPRFFCDDELFARGLDHYAQTHFAKAVDEVARGDASPHYLFFEKTAQRIRELIAPNGHRFVVLLRDPVERAYSHYWNAVYEGLEDLPFEEALAREALRNADPEHARRGRLPYAYFAAGLYARQLRLWLRYFERDRFLVLLHDDLRSNPLGLLREVSRFLAVREDFAPRPVGTSNPAGLPVSTRLHALLRRPHWSKRPLKVLLPETLRHRIATAVLRWNKRSFAYAPMPPQVAEELRRCYRDDVKELMALTGRDLSGWLGV